MSLWSRIERRITDLAEELLPDEFRAQIEESHRLIDAGECAEAVVLIEALLSERPDHLGALSLLGAARLELGDGDGAHQAFSKVLAQDGQIGEALLGRGEANLLLGKLEAAVRDFRAAVKHAGGERALLAEAYRGLGLTHRRRGDVDKAVRELRKAVAEAPADGIALAALGDALLQIDYVAKEEAQRYLDRALEADDTPAVAWLALGRLALEDQRIGEAEDLFARALRSARDKLDPSRNDQGEALIGLGDTRLAAADTSGAHQHYLRALELDPSRALIHARIGDAHRQVNDLSAALASYMRSLDLMGCGGGPNPGVSGAKLDLMGSSGGSSSGAAARARAPDPVRPSSSPGVAGAKLDLSEELPVLRRALDTALLGQDIDPAVDLANRMLAHEADNPRALVARGIALARDGNSAAARATFLAALELGDDIEAHLALGALELAATADPTAGSSAARSGLAALRLDPRSQRGRELLAAARARELGVASPAADTSQVADDSDHYRLAVQLQELTLARAEISGLAGETALAAADFDQPLLVTVMGEFSSGKSSFVNAFIGAEVAPTGITPTTATINIVKYGRERGGRIIYQDGRIETLSWDDLFPALRDLDAEAARKVKLAEILLPLEQLERINIVDTPGLNSILPEHEQVARDFIARADAVVWLFTANQAGKASEREALASIRSEGVRVLGVLNKRDQLAAGEVDEVLAYVGAELEELVESVVPLSARNALAWRHDPQTDDDGNWPALATALEERFFAHAREIKRQACDRRLGALIARARQQVDRQRDEAISAAEILTAAAGEIRTAEELFAEQTVPRQRRTLSAAVANLNRLAAREILELVQPRRLPFGSHSATRADRDYLISLLDAGYEVVLEDSRRDTIALLRADHAKAAIAAGPACQVVGIEAASDILRTGEDAARLLEAQVFASCRAYLRGYLRGGYVDRFFERDLPKISLDEDSIYHALFRDAPNLDNEIAAPLLAAGSRAIAALAERLEHWAGVADVLDYDIEVGIARALEALDERRRSLLE